MSPPDGRSYSETKVSLASSVSGRARSPAGRFLFHGRRRCGRFHRRRGRGGGLVDGRLLFLVQRHNVRRWRLNNYEQLLRLVAFFSRAAKDALFHNLTEMIFLVNVGVGNNKLKCAMAVSSNQTSHRWIWHSKKHYRERTLKFTP